MIIVIRHERSVANDDASLYNIIPQLEISLTEKGKENSQEIRKKLLLSLRQEEFYQDNIVFSSPATRTLETAKIIIEDDTHIKSNPLLIEQQWGHATGSDNMFDYIKTDSKELNRFKIDGYFYYRPPGGESLFDVYKRVVLFFQENEIKKNRLLNYIFITHCITAQVIDYYLTGKEVNPDCLLQPGKLWKNGEFRVYTQ